MLAVQLRSGLDALRLEPDQQISAVLRAFTVDLSAHVAHSSSRDH
jgi:hypothetical protein